MLTVTLCRSECCVPSGLDFEAAGDSAVRYFVSNYLLRGLRVAVLNMTWALFRGCGNSRKSAHPHFGRLVRCSAHGRSFGRLRYTYISVRCTLLRAQDWSSAIMRHGALVSALADNELCSPSTGASPWNIQPRHKPSS